MASLPHLCTEFSFTCGIVVVPYPSYEIAIDRLALRVAFAKRAGDFPGQRLHALGSKARRQRQTVQPFDRPECFRKRRSEITDIVECGDL